MKILLLCGDPFKNYGGLQTHVINLSNQLSHLENDKNDISMLMFDDRNSEIVKGCIRYRRIKKNFYLYLFPLLAVKKLIDRINQISPDIIHIHGTSFSPYIIAALLLKNKYPVIITIHGSSQIEFHFKRGIDRLIGNFSKYFERYFISHFSYAILVSTSLAQVIKKLPAKIFNIPNGVTINNNFDIQSIYIDTGRAPKIIFVGRLVKIKGVEILLMAINNIKIRYPNLLCFIIGDGPDKDRLENIVDSYKLNSNIVFLGQMDNKYIVSYLKSSDIFILPSFFDSQAIVLLEAMACGLPVIASNLEGPASMLKNGEIGLLFKKGNANDLAEKIVTIMCNNQLKNMLIEKGKKEAREYSWDKIADRTFKTYEEVIMAWKKKKG